MTEVATYHLITTANQSIMAITTIIIIGSSNSSNPIIIYLYY